MNRTAKVDEVEHNEFTVTAVMVQIGGLKKLNDQQGQAKPPALAHLNRSSTLV